MDLSKSQYRQLIDADLKWLRKIAKDNNDFEKAHIAKVLKNCKEQYQDPSESPDLDQVLRSSAQAESAFHKLQKEAQSSGSETIVNLIAEYCDLRKQSERIFGDHIKQIINQ